MVVVAPIAGYSFQSTYMAVKVAAKGAAAKAAIAAERAVAEAAVAAAGLEWLHLQGAFQTGHTTQPDTPHMGFDTFRTDHTSETEPERDQQLACI